VESVTRNSELTATETELPPAVRELAELWQRLNRAPLETLDLDSEAGWELWGCQDDGREGPYPERACAYCLVRNALNALGFKELYRPAGVRAEAAEKR
jgi:hypothetical protein